MRSNCCYVIVSTSIKTSHNFMPEKFIRSVFWMPESEHNALVKCAKSLKPPQSKSKLGRAGIRREVARIEALKKK